MFRRVLPCALVLLVAGCGGSGSSSGTAAPASTAAALSAHAPPATVGSGLFVSRVALDARTLVSVAWSSDASALVAVERRGVVRKLRESDLTELASVDLARPARGLTISSEGPVVLLDGPSTLAVLDPDTLALRREIALPGGAEWVAGAPALAVAYATTREHDETLWVVDLAAGRVARTLVARTVWANRGAARLHPDGVVLTGFAMPEVSPDGRFLFCVGFECLHRFRIAGDDLVYEEMGPRIGQNAQRIEVDEHRVALPSGGGNYVYSGAPALQYGTYVFAHGDLGAAIETVESGAYPRALGLAPARTYAQRFDDPLVAFERGVEKLALDHKMLGTSGETRRLLVHPTGWVLVVTIDTVVRVDVP